MSKISKQIVDSIFNKFGKTAAIDLAEVAKSYGVEIVEKEMDDSISGMLVTNKNKSAIVVNSTHKLHRKRFTIAHELGHYFLHNEPNAVFVDNVNILYRSKDTAGTRKEIDANYFAAELLMPETVIKKEISNIDSNIFDEDMAKELADKFEVSPQALIYRLLNLGLIRS